MFDLAVVNDVECDAGSRNVGISASSSGEFSAVGVAECTKVGGYRAGLVVWGVEVVGESTSGEGSSDLRAGALSRTDSCDANRGKMYDKSIQCWVIGCLLWASRGEGGNEVEADSAVSSNTVVTGGEQNRYTTSTELSIRIAELAVITRQCQTARNTHCFYIISTLTWLELWRPKIRRNRNW